VYRDTWRTLPPASTVGEDGQLLHSWRTQLLPFLEHRNPSSHLRWDEPWNSANNQGVDLAYEPGILYHCPADNGGSSPRNTSYLAAIGHGTLWSRIKGRSDQTDASDSEQYILLVEGANTGIHWMEPRDWNADEVNCSLDSPTPGNISSGHAGGVNVFLGDGSVRCLPRDTPPGDLKTMLTVPGLPSTSEDGSAAKMEPSTSGDVNTCK
jgi:prepilin-type processing-associated H-X9-DG protein